MIFTATQLDDAWLIDLEPRRRRARLLRPHLVPTRARGARPRYRYCPGKPSSNRHRGTVRGLHFQRAPHEETKIVRCTRGGIFDVIVDLRPQSASYLRWQGFELTAENRKALYVPKGFAHGFQSLADNAEIVYQISEFYAPNSAAGYRYNDVAFGIAWPLPVTAISERDLAWPAFKAGASVLPMT